MTANLESSMVATGLEKFNFHSNTKEGQCQRMFNYRTIVLIPHASKVITNSTDRSLSKLLEMVKDRDAWPAVVLGWQRITHDLATEQQ